MQEHGSTDGHFLHFLHTSNFLFLLGTENAMGGVGLWLCMPSCLYKEYKKYIYIQNIGHIWAYIHVDYWDF